MTPDEFRRHGHETIEWVARYMENVASYPVLSPVEPGDVRAALPPSPPEQGEPFEAVLGDLDRAILPGITHWQSPRFFAFFPGNASGPAILGELLSAGLGVQGMLWASSPGCTEVETLMLDWLVELLDLPAAFLSTGRGGGVIQDSASSATLCALLAARHRAGTNDLVVYTSNQAHSSVEKAARVAGLTEPPRFVDVDESFAMRPEALAKAMAADSDGAPSFVCATVGTTSSTALDPVPAITEVARQHGAWLHVDAAFAGSAAVCPELRFVNDGLEAADSYCFNPHKWLLTNFDCDCLWVADRSTLISALSVLPEYLRNAASESGAVIDYRDWQIPLGRRFRALKLMATLRWYGAEGLRSHIRSGVALAQELAGWVKADPDFELAAPVPLSLVCLRHVGGDEVNQRILDAVNRSGRAYLTHTRLDGRLTIRVAIGNPHTALADIRELWDLMLASAAPAAR